MGRDRSHEPGDTGFDEDAWAAVIGPRAGYYMPRFRRRVCGALVLQWNWAACLFTLPWLMYRRMRVWATVHFIFGLTWPAIAWMAQRHDASVPYRALILAFVLPGALANTLYYLKCRWLLRPAWRRGGSRRWTMSELSARGGAESRWIVAEHLILMSMVACVAAVTIPTYMDMKDRALADEAIDSVAEAARRMSDDMVRTGAPPPAELPPPIHRNRHLVDYAFDQARGVVTIEIDTGRVQGRATLRATRCHEGPILWSCSTDAPLRRVVGASCREEVKPEDLRHRCAEAAREARRAG